MNALYFSNVSGFDWDGANRFKSEKKHSVSWEETEEVFFDNPRFFRDEKHSGNEERYLCYGLTPSGKGLTIVFTLRESGFRVISARPQSRKERNVYEKLTKKK